jgi:alkylation response protein AidB-like acyl-CoA dehydrogenase
VPSGWTGIGSLPMADRDAFMADWRARVGAERLIAVSWPEEYGGRGLNKLDQLVVVEEFGDALVPLFAPGDTISVKLFGNTLEKWGTPEQKARFLPRIVSGEELWCQGYSEPGSGSDLASLRTRAALRDGRWHVDGQKIWTSNAANADWMFALVRTDPDASPSRGITMLMLPMRQPGVDVRPITMISGGQDFCEVFLTDATTDEDLVVGTVNDGWTVANSLLTHERGEEAAVNPVLFGQELDRIVALMRETGADADPELRTRLADLFMRLWAMKAMGDRILETYVRDGSLGAESSVSKLFWSEYHKAAAALGVDALGTAALRYEGDGPLRWYRADEPGAPNSSRSWLEVYLQNALSGTVYAGTSEIQRNIIAERILGLPREPRVR